MIVDGTWLLPERAVVYNVAALLVIGGYLMRFFSLIQAGTKKMTGSNNAFFFLGGGFWGCVAPVC